ncbi:MAG: RIP metalloprotease RseP [Rhodospirillaceae bacterium]
MEPMFDALSLVWTYIIPFLAVLTVLVFVHELGHYLAARRCGIRVEVFSVGFGRELFGWTDRSGTRWKLSLIPVGGYVKMFGEMQARNDGEGAVHPELSPEDAAVSFETKSLGQRAFVVFAGPLANFVFAIVVLAAMFSTIGQPFTPADIGQVLPDSAAERAGFQVGDVITEIDGRKVERFEQVIRNVQLHPGTLLHFTVERDGRIVVLDVVPDVLDQTDRFGNPQRIGRLGVSRPGTDMKLVRHDPFTAVWRATQETYVLTESIFSAIWQIIKGTRTTKELGGPIRIAQMSGDVAQMGLISLLMFATVLSINLGLINLFPVPMLDGGHLLFYGIEALRGRPLGARAQEFGLRVGVGMVFALMVFATWNDLVQLRVVDFFVGLVT